MQRDDRAPGGQPADLTPDQLRRFQLWRAMTDLANAQSDSRLTPDQLRLLESLAGTLQQLATQLGQLAALGQQCVDLLDPGRAASRPGAPVSDER